MKMAKSRPPIPPEIVDKIMVQCKHKCCWCEENEATKIHHLDNNPSNNDEDNLFPCCSLCQEKIHTSTPFTRKITENELKQRRDIFYNKSHLDVNVYEEIKEIKMQIQTLTGGIIKNGK